MPHLPQIVFFPAILLACVAGAAIGRLYPFLRINNVKPKRQIESIDSRQLESLRMFNVVARALTSNLELDSLLRTIMAQMEDFLGPEQWSLLLMDEDKPALRYALSSGLDDELFQDVRIPLGEGIAGYVASTGDPLVVPDLSADPDWSQYAATHPELHLQSIACLPILHGDRTLGVLQVNNSKLDLLPDSSISFLRVLCDYTAIALENARNVKLVHDLSITDDCTGLFNARYFYRRLDEEIASCTEKGRVVSIQVPHFSLLFLDLDRFKSINDTHGHLIGSALLEEIGGVIKRAIGPENAAFRYGGDEFVCLLCHLDKPAAVELAGRVREALITTTFLTSPDQNLHIQMTGSFGLATFPQDGATQRNIVRTADTMMYQAKTDGRNRIVVADGPTQPDDSIKGSRHT